MKYIIIAVSVVVPILVAVVLSWALYKYRQSELKKAVPKKNTQVFKFDLRTRRVLLMNALKVNVSAFRELVPNEWDSVQIITSRFSEDVQKQFMTAFDKLDKGAERVVFEFNTPSLFYKRHEAIYKVKFSKIEDGTGYYMSMTWDAFKPQKMRTLLQSNHIEKEDVAVSSSRWKGFVAFNVRGGEQYIQRLIELVSHLYKVREIDYFISSGYLIFVFYGDKASKVKSKINKFVRLFLGSGYRKGGGQLFEGSATFISASADNVKTINKIVQTLDYLISLSIESKTSFVTWNKDMSKEEFETFVEASKSFRLSVRSKDIVNSSQIVRNWKSNRKVVEYFYPEIVGINSKLMSRILRNKNHIDFLIDAHADATILEHKLDKPGLVDVTPHWIFKNENNIKNKDIIYVVRADSHKEVPGLADVLTRLTAKGFIFAIKVYDYTEVMTTLIQAVRPQFIVVSKGVWNTEGLLDSEMLFKLMTIRKLSDQIKARIIYQEPSKLVDANTAEKIGLQFFYDVQE